MDADLLGLGEHCAVQECRQIDFLPFTCDCCKRVYCKFGVRVVLLTSFHRRQLLHLNRQGAESCAAANGELPRGSRT